MHKLAHSVNRINEQIGKWLSWLNVGMAVLIFVIVILRYVFDASWVWMQELSTYFHSLIFLTCMAWVLKTDDHVRVDILYRGFSERKKAIVNVAGHVIFLFPMCYLLISRSWPYVVSSWSVYEASADAGGLPGVFLLKTLIPLGAALLALQGVAHCLELLLRRKSES